MSISVGLGSRFEDISESALVSQQMLVQGRYAGCKKMKA